MVDDEPRLASVSSASAEGFALVPRKLDPAMASAGWSKVNVGLINGDQAAMEQLWIALVDAAPKPEPVPATNQAGEVEQLRAALALALPWLSAPLDDRDQSASGTAYRAVAAALATQPATSQEGEAAITEQAIRCLSCGAQVVSMDGSMRCDCRLIPWSASPAEDGEDIDDLWLEICEMDDRTSPAEYPEMCMLTREEFAEFIARARPPLAATPTPPTLSAHDLQAAWDRVDSLPAIEFKQAEADEILAALALAQVKAS